MTINEFIWKVAQMREAQKAYFDTHHKGALKAACKLERQIDKQLDAFRYWFDNCPEYSYDWFDANESYITELLERLEQF